MKGVLYLDESLKKPLREMVSTALALFRSKYTDKRPLLVQLNSQMLAEETAVAGITAQPSPYVLPHHVYVVFEVD